MPKGGLGERKESGIGTAPAITDGEAVGKAIRLSRRCTRLDGGGTAVGSSEAIALGLVAGLLAISPCARRTRRCAEDLTAMSVAALPHDSPKRQGWRCRGDSAFLDTCTRAFALARPLCCEPRRTSVAGQRCAPELLPALDEDGWRRKFVSKLLLPCSRTCRRGFGSRRVWRERRRPPVSSHGALN